MDLLGYLHAQKTKASEPLAARMRPRTLDEFVGQDAIVGPGRLLRRAIQADQLSSLLFYGPPGTGKTTLAQIIANTTLAHFIALNAVLSGVKDIRASVEEAARRRNDHGQRTILFVDEVHRFNKSQQDALLPWVENGTVILIGATTENPYFEVNKALVSRSRVFQLRSLNEEDLRRVVQQALLDEERGFGEKNVVLSEEALSHLVNISNGDARSVLNALELAVETTSPDEEGRIFVSLEVAEESIQRRALLYDKEGDAHFDTISAFIKSIRGSDPDATLYWLARMVYAGEDPRFLFRRMLIAASEDVGLADPQAIAVVQACAASFDRVGMPEGQYPLAQAALTLALASKSNSTMGYFDAFASVKKEREGDVPNHLKDGSRDKHSFGHGQGYLYPHAYREHWVAQQYLPTSLQGQIFYQPSSEGYEGKLREQVARRREEQLAAYEEGESLGPPEVLTFSPRDAARERWLQRTRSQIGARLGIIRDRVIKLASLQRHHTVLDLHAGSGLLTWEALRGTPEGGVIARTSNQSEAEQLRQQAQRLQELSRPVFLACSLDSMASSLEQHEAGLKFDAILGFNVLLREADKAQRLQEWRALLRPEGRVVLAETVTRRTQRLSALLRPEWLEKSLLERLQQAEDVMFTDENDPMVNWDVDDLIGWGEASGFDVQSSTERWETEICLTPAVLERWFATDLPRPSYAQRLSGTLAKEELLLLRSLFERRLHQMIAWKTTTVFVRLTPAD
jgi:putative ATPase